MGNINFTASLIARTKVLKQSDDGYKPVNVSIVELDKYDPKDIQALRKTSFLWTSEGGRYASEIYNEAIKGYEYDNVEQEHYFAVTEQDSDFSNLDSSKLLGLMLYSQTNYSQDEINWLQVRPDTNYINSHNRKYKKVGEAFINLIKNVNVNKPVYVNSADNAVDFYKKQGFVNCANNVPTSLYLEA